ncbi:MBL fold metallo-hydrolase [Pseudomonadales bacterium]|nr:MBL fold metallo-hydrolase [Pseudomonadales bacterium]MDC0464842.1 MBL fold metallo-hydrolase [Pseudomonadales bacterium]
MSKRVWLILLGILMAALATSQVVLRSDTIALALTEVGLRSQMVPEPLPVETLTVVVCGSASPLGDSPDRAQACIAVLTDKHFLIFDAGSGSQVRLNQAGLPLNRLDGVFLTHLHSDHIAEIPDVNLARWAMSGTAEPLKVYGPTGVSQVVDGFNQAFGLDRGYRVAHHGEDFMPKTGGQTEAITIAPGVVFSAAGLTVTAFTVDHHPINPAFGYRVDYGGRSVVISGDTVNTPRLWAAAEGADLVFHDALARPVLEVMHRVALEVGRDRAAKIVMDVTDYHAGLEGLQASADAAGVRRLVLYHLVPSPPNALVAGFFKRAVVAPSIMAEDLMRFELPRDSEEIQGP